MKANVETDKPKFFKIFRKTSSLWLNENLLGDCPAAVIN